MGRFKDFIKKASRSDSFKAIIGAVPFGIGDIATGILTDTRNDVGQGSEAGTISAAELPPRAAKLLFYAGLLYSTLHCILEVFN